MDIGNAGEDAPQQEVLVSRLIDAFKMRAVDRDPFIHPLAQLIGEIGAVIIQDEHPLAEWQDGIDDALDPSRLVLHAEHAEDGHIWAILLSEISEAFCGS